MTKLDRDKNTATGVTSCKIVKMVFEAIDPFLDNYAQELFVCHGIMDLMRVNTDKTITITLNKEFLNKVLKTYIHSIRGLF